MKISISDGPESMSSQAADELKRIMGVSTHKLLCPASGNTPKLLYQNLVDQYRKKALDVHAWSFVGLDEWVGVNQKDEGSCRYNIQGQLLTPLEVKEDRISFFDGCAPNLRMECRKAEDFISAQGGIEIAVLGLGMNGHVGFNEPGTPAQLFSHVTDLDETTRTVGQKYFPSRKALEKGITLGMATLLRARNIFLVVSGDQKAEIVKRVFESEISTDVPGSLLRKHPHLWVFLDKAAAGTRIWADTN